MTAPHADRDHPESPTVAEHGVADHADARRARYAKACGTFSWHRTTAHFEQAIDAVMAVADAEQADLGAEVENQRQSARTAWDVHAEHVETMNRRLLHEQAVAEERRAENDRLRQGLWHTWAALGHDTDGDTGPGALIAGMGVDGFIGMVVRDATKWRQESEDDYDADTSRLEAEISRLRVEVSQLQADLTESEEEVARQYREAQVAETKVARVEALVKWLHDEGWNNIFETSGELAYAVEVALSGVKCDSSCPPNCHAQHAPRFNSRRSAGE
jgi:hypothetical protein